MKIIVLHGDDTAKVNSRYQKFIEVAKERGMSVMRLNKDSNIIDHLTSQNLFSQKVLYVLNDPKKIDKKVLAWIDSNEKDFDEKVFQLLLLFFE